jgi:hypothetical protein
LQEIRLERNTSSFGKVLWLTAITKQM